MRALLILAMVSSTLPAAAAPKGPAVKLERRDAEQRVDVVVDGRPFTSYMWSQPEKPVLFPINDATGACITRGYPLAPRPGESTDHPHHAGIWFNYGEVKVGDGEPLDFWANSEEQRKNKPGGSYGRIVHRAIKTVKGGAGRGDLAVGADWIALDGRVVLQEDTRFAFFAGDGRRAIDRVATLTASDAVTFPDNKEGAYGLRLADVLNLPGVKNRQGGTGQYFSSEGKTGDAAWGTRARWMLLTGKVDGKPVSIAMLDHPKNPGHPTYWHARGYGLFAANPFGQSAFSKGKETFNFALAKGKSARFAWRVVILSREANPDEIEAEYKAFVREVK